MLLSTRFALLVLGSLLVACQSSSPTGVLVVVDSNLSVPTALQAVRIRVYGSHGEPLLDDGQTPESTIDVTDEGPAQHTLPLSFGIAPENVKSSQGFRLVVTGLVDQLPVVEQQVVASFRVNATLRLELFLADACRAKLCGEPDSEQLAEQTCNPESGRCEDIPVAQDLPRADPHEKLGGYTRPAAEAGSEGPDEEHDAASSDASDLDGGAEAGADGAIMDAQHEDAEPAPACDSRDASCACKAFEERAPDGGCRSIDDCVSNACLNGSTCVDGTNGYSCDCGASGCTGMYCESCPTTCAGIVCQHGGTCAGGVCQCTGTGFDGSRCEHDIDDCVGNLCINGSTCTDLVKGYACDCGSSGCSGARCESCPGDPCLNLACQHGTCAQGACQCGSSGYIGTLCETATSCAGPNLCPTSYSATYPCKASTAADYTCRGQFADWPMPDRGNKVSPSYESTADVVIDKVTGLIWERVILEGMPYKRRWQDSITYCEGVTTGGYSDWRLPTKIELESLVDITALPAIDPTAFPDTPSDVFWTSSPCAGAASSAWAIAFGGGDTQALGTTKGAYARCVR